jgi:acyl-coenzyme A thioesterase PaaI-like protein
MAKHPDARKAINELAFVKSHGIEIVSIEDGVARVRMPFSPRFATLPDLFPTAMVGMVGDVAAVGACFAAVPADHACATLDFTVKNTGLASGEALYAEGRALMVGKTISVGSADVYVMNGDTRRHCGTVLATARVYKVKGEGPSNGNG